MTEIKYTQKTPSIHLVMVGSDRTGYISAGEIYMEVDGFWVYEMDRTRCGYVESWFLRAIANKLDEMNAEWEKQIEEYFRKNPCPEYIPPKPEEKEDPYGDLIKEAIKYVQRYEHPVVKPLPVTKGGTTSTPNSSRDDLTKFMVKYYSK